MTDIRFQTEPLDVDEQSRVTAGFASHAREQGAPPFVRTDLTWRALDARGELVGVLTGVLLWDWLYIDELWVDASQRGTGLGRTLMLRAEQHAASASIVGVWLWTQSWQAEGFYRHLGYEEFTRFPDFPRGHARLGFRKTIARD